MLRYKAGPTHGDEQCVFLRETGRPCRGGGGAGGGNMRPPQPWAWALGPSEPLFIHFQVAIRKHSS